MRRAVCGGKMKNAPEVHWILSRISAQRMNVNSHGCEPMEQNLENPVDPDRVKQDVEHEVRPLQGWIGFIPCSMGFTHGYSRCSPSGKLQQGA
jgi:hypothetical protein